MVRSMNEKDRQIFFVLFSIQNSKFKRLFIPMCFKYKTARQQQGQTEDFVLDEVWFTQQCH